AAPAIPQRRPAILPPSCAPYHLPQKSGTVAIPVLRARKPPSTAPINPATRLRDRPRGELATRPARRLINIRARMLVWWLDFSPTGCLDRRAPRFNMRPVNGTQVGFFDEC